MSRNSFLPKPTPRCVKCKSSDIYDDPNDDPQYTCKACGACYSAEDAARVALACPASPGDLPTGIGDEAPLTAGEIIGWRAWKVVNIGTDACPVWRLNSPVYPEIWEPGKAMTATCQYGHTGANIPEPECSCGYYTAVSREHLLSLSYHTYNVNAVYHGDMNQEIPVIGQVALCGRVVVGTQGWRAQKCWALSLEVPPFFWRVVKPLSEAYGIPVNIAGTMNGRTR